MKLYLSVDMEGISGVAAWDEVRKGHHDYEPHRTQMAIEARAACEGALSAGCVNVVVKDAHATGRNIRNDELPAGCSLIRGWSGHPYAMVQDISRDFSGVAFVGYHSPASSGGNPLSHTMSSAKFAEVTLNDSLLSEWRLHSLIAASYGVPCVLATGDEVLMAEVRSVSPTSETVISGSGIGESMVSRNAAEVEAEIRAKCQLAIEQLAFKKALPLPKQFELTVTFRDHPAAYRASFYPGVEQTSERTVRYHCKTILEVATAMRFF